MTGGMGSGYHRFVSSAPFLIGCLLIMTSLVISTSASKFVHEINKRSLDKFLEGKYFTLTYVDSPSCTRCRNLYPFYETAARAFPDDPEIFFTRTFDKELIQRWEIEELPALIFHREGLDKPKLMQVDVTVDDIIDEIGRLLGGDFSAMTRYYSISLTKNNYDEMVLTPKQSVIVLVHDEDTQDKLEIIEKVAYTFRKDDAILIANIDVEAEKALRDERFLTKDVPSLMWLSAKDKPTAKRFGGMLTRVSVVLFINHQTGLHRTVEGAMNPEAGRIPAIDELLNEYLDVLYEVDVDKLHLLSAEINKRRESVEPYMIEMLDYYMFVLDEIAMTGQRSSVTISNLYRGLENKLIEDEDLSTKATETLKRHKNIVEYIQGLLKKYSKGEWTIQAEERTPLASEAESVAYTNAGHVHTEL